MCFTQVLHIINWIELIFYGLAAPPFNNSQLRQQAGSQSVWTVNSTQPHTEGSTHPVVFSNRGRKSGTCEGCAGGETGLFDPLPFLLCVWWIDQCALFVPSLSLSLSANPSLSFSVSPPRSLSQEEEIPELEIDVDELLDMPTDGDRASRVKVITKPGITLLPNYRNYLFEFHTVLHNTCNIADYKVQQV